jgi:hypothetical protein
LLLCPATPAAPPADLFDHGQSVALEKAIPANERGILCLTVDDKGRVFGGTTGRAAHLFVYDPAKDQVRSLARLNGGVGFAYALVRLPDGSFLGGTQADPTGIAVKTDPKAVGRLYRFTLAGDGPARVEDLGVPVAGQGIYTLAYVAASNEVVGNTWPDGHFFSYDLKAKTFKDHGAVAGHRTYELPRHAEAVNRGTGRQVSYPRQVSRTIAVDPHTGAYTGGADAWLHRYDPAARRLEKLTLRLPAVAGREPWASLDAAAVYRCTSGEAGDYTCVVGGTSDGHLFELPLFSREKTQLRPRGKALAQGTVQALVAVPSGGAAGSHSVLGVGGGPEGMPRAFRFSHGASTSEVTPGGIPRADGQPSMVGFGALAVDNSGNLYAGERDRLARLVRYRLDSKAPPRKSTPKPRDAEPAAGNVADSSAKLDCRVVFAPEGTTTDGSGYTAIEVGKDGLVYVGTARYGDYAWLLRFDPARQPLFMDKVVNLKHLTGERLQGINTQGKIHAKLLVGGDGRIWFASKQAHEVFATRPEYGEDADGYPGGHLCYFDPKSGFSRSVGILKRQEGLMAGALDDARGRLYYRSEPKNHFLVYDPKTGDVQDRGHTGHNGRYMALDKYGAVYSPGRGAYLSRYDPATDYIEELAIKVEGAGGYRAPYVVALCPNGKLYGVAAGHPWVMEFDIDTYKKGDFPEVTMRNAAPAAPAGLVAQNIHAGVFGRDGRFYFPLNTSVTTEKSGKPQPQLRIMRFDPITRKTETVGTPHVVGLDEDKVKHVYARGNRYELRHMQGAAIGPDGSLYLLVIQPQLHVACFPRLTAPSKDP